MEMKTKIYIFYAISLCEKSFWTNGNQDFFLMVSQVITLVGFVLLSHYTHLGRGKINELFLPKMNNIITFYNK
jgi:hypothetical protein